MKKYMKYLIMIFLAVFFVGIFSACAPEKEEEPKQLATPTGLTLYEYEVTWDEVEKAKTYAVVVDEGVEKWVKYNFYEIEDYPEEKTFVIKVKAVGDGVKYIDSDWAEYTYVYEEPNAYLKYTLLNNGLGYEVGKKNANPNQGLKGRVVIPDFYNGLPVKKIADNAFYWDILNPDPETGINCNTSTTSVRLPAYLETIGEKAFLNCVALEEIDIPKSVTRIEEGAFANCIKIREFIIPERVTSIEDRTFANTAITKLPIHENIKEIGGAAFQSCDNLEEVEWPAHITKIERALFRYCSKLKKIIIPDTVTEIGESAFVKCESLESIVIPKNVTTVGEYLFNGCKNLKEVTLPSGITEINQGMFYNCSSLEGIELPMSVTSIGENAFGRCSNLKESPIHENIVSIGNQAFYECDSLTEVVIPAGVSFIGEDRAFNNCLTLKKITVAEENENYYSVDGNLYSADGVLLQYAPGKTDTFFKTPEGTTAIAHQAFMEINSLTEIEIAEGVTSIGKRAFKNCSNLMKVTIPEGVLSIGEFAFAMCLNLTELTIPDSVTSIGENAFGSCYALTSISFGANANFGNERTIFSGARKLKNITVSEENEHYRTIDGNLYTKDGTVLLQYANGKEDTWFKVPDGVTKIVSYAFMGNESLTVLELPKSITTIETRIFSVEVDNNDRFISVYYHGTLEDREACDVAPFAFVGRFYCYSETPTTQGNVWHYDEKGEIVIW